MTLSTVDPLTVLISPKGDLTRPHLDTHAIHCCHKPATNDWHNPLRYRVFVPVVGLPRHQGQKHNGARIITGAGLPDTWYSIDKGDQFEVLQRLLCLMTYPLLITPHMPNVKARLQCGGGGHAEATQTDSALAGNGWLLGPRP